MPLPGLPLRRMVTIWWNFTPGTIGAYGDSLKALRSYFLDVAGDPRVDRLTPGGVRAFISWRRTHRLRYDKQPDGTVVRCPWHNWSFRLDSGQHCLDPTEKIRTFQVRMEGDQVILCA